VDGLPRREAKEGPETPLIFFRLVLRKPRRPSSIPLNHPKWSKLMKKAWAYYRCSRRSQKISGLGLAAQRAAVEAFASSNGFEIVGSFEDVESGKRDDRPELAKCLACARRSQGTVLVAKLDRMSRSVSFLSRLLDSRTPFIAVDNPHCNELTVHLLAAVAQWERKAISDRTRQSLVAARLRGQKLGSQRPGHWDGREERRRFGGRKGGQVAARVHRKAADDAYSDIAPQMHQMRRSGMTLQAIADALNIQGQTTRRGCPWNTTQVLRVLRRTRPPAP